MQGARPERAYLVSNRTTVRCRSVDIGPRQCQRWKIGETMRRSIYSPTKESGQRLNLKYRYYMRKYPRGLIKVISSIPQSYRNVLIRQRSVKDKGQDSGQNFGDSIDESTNQDLRHIVGELKTLLYTWNDPAIDQLLLLLSQEYSLYNLNTNVIREYAINKLNQFADSVLLQFCWS